MRPVEEGAAIRPALDILRAPEWNQSWLMHGFSSRGGGTSRVYRPESSEGDLNLGFSASDHRENVLANRRLFVDALAQGREIRGLVTLRQIHSSQVWRVDAEELTREDLRDGDGLMTDSPGVLIGVQTADCVPILVADRKRRAVAAFHAGWRGTVARIVEKGIGLMRLEFGSQPEDLIAAVGPAIGPCCYVIGGDVRDQFEAQFSYAAELFVEAGTTEKVTHTNPVLSSNDHPSGQKNRKPGLYLDLAEANRRQLLEAGLKESAVYLTRQCTGCHTGRFFSHRTEQGFTGRMMSVIGVAGS